MNIFKKRQYIKEPEVVYELKPGNVYLVEYAVDSVSKASIDAAYRRLKVHGIEVIFIENLANHVAFTPVPATPNKEIKNDRS